MALKLKSIRNLTLAASTVVSGFQYGGQTAPTVSAVPTYVPTVFADTVAALTLSIYAPGAVIGLKRGNVYAGPLTFSASGTTGNPIVLTCYGDPTLPAPQITGDASTYDNALNLTGTYVVLDHLLFSNSHYAGVYIGSKDDYGNYIPAPNNVIQYCEMTNLGEGVNCLSSNTLITKNYIHDLNMIVNNGNINDYGANGVVVGAGNVEISWNIFARCKAQSIAFGYDGGALEVYIPSSATADSISFHDNFVDSCDGVTECGGAASTAIISNLSVYNNICINNGEFATIHNSGQFAATFINCNFYNNTIVDENNVTSTNSSVPGTGLYFDYDAGSPISAFHIYNNIVAMNGGYYLYKWDEQTTHYNQDYWFYGLALAAGGAAGLHIYNDHNNTPLGSGEFIADPLFNNQSARDFTLQNGSPAIGMGGNAAAFNTALNAALIAQIQG